MKYLAQITVMLLVLYGTKGGHWSYSNQETWAEHYPNCGLNAQSPIAIDTQKAIPKEMPPLQFFNYDTVLDAVIINNCHTAEITLPAGTSEAIPEISGGPFNATDRYAFVNAHFHWKAEHVINSRRYTMELHIVHINTKYSHEDARNHKDGYAVIATFYRYGLRYDFPGLQNMNMTLPHIRKCGTSAKLKNFVLSSLVGGVKTLTNQKLYTYKGSFTTPPCSEAVDFLIFPEVIGIGVEQYGLFRQLMDDSGSKIATNFRYLKNQGDRVIYVWPTEKKRMQFSIIECEIIMVRT